MFYAPHIAGMSSAMGTRFEPIRYTLAGEQLLSHVRYNNALLGQGWLSAAGEWARWLAGGAHAPISALSCASWPAFTVADCSPAQRWPGEGTKLLLSAVLVP